MNAERLKDCGGRERERDRESELERERQRERARERETETEIPCVGELRTPDMQVEPSYMFQTQLSTQLAL